MATQPTLQGYTLPWPSSDSGYNEGYGQRAVSLEMANGNYAFQRITTAAKREFTIEWVAISDSEYTTVKSAYDALLSTGGSNNFTAPTGSTYTVTPAANNPQLDARYINTPGGVRWSVTMKLRQVST